MAATVGIGKVRNRASKAFKTLGKNIGVANACGRFRPDERRVHESDQYHHSLTCCRRYRESKLAVDEYSTFGEFQQCVLVCIGVQMQRTI